MRRLGLAGLILIVGACGYPDPDAGKGPVATTTASSAGGAAADDFNEGAGVTPVRFPDGLQYVDLKVGTGATAVKDAKLRVQYTGWLTNGKKFDSSRDRGEPFEVTIGEGQVIPGWDEGVPGMRVGGKRRLIIPPALGYGAQGQPPTIPPNSTLVFAVELVDVTPPLSPSPSASPTR